MTAEELDALRPEIAKLSVKYGLTELSVFGSTARHEARPDSDVDFLYVRGPHAVRGLAFLRLQDELRALLGRPVDLVPKDGLHWVIREHVLRDAEVLYAA